ncbi:hypothetical protein F5Y18DRAFT_261642 [Xylariaceae sp. FL1019]|nr:hypothetical protein F5Y18DRAFT_261642 [Xylariaceae sp. FL1019]
MAVSGHLSVCIAASFADYLGFCWGSFCGRMMSQNSSTSHSYWHSFGDGGVALALFQSSARNLFRIPCHRRRVVPCPSVRRPDHVPGRSVLDKSIGISRQLFLFQKVQEIPVEAGREVANLFSHEYGDSRIITIINGDMVARP